MSNFKRITALAVGITRLLRTLRFTIDYSRFVHGNVSIGIIKRIANYWKIDGAKDQKFVDAIGGQIEKWNL